MFREKSDVTLSNNVDLYICLLAFVIHYYYYYIVHFIIGICVREIKCGRLD